MSLLLSDEAIVKECKTAIFKHCYEPDMQAIAKAQLKHTLEQLEKEGRLKKGHEEWRGLDFHGEWRCKPDCWLCAALREVGA